MTTTFTNQSKSTSLTGYAYNSSYAYNDASIEYNYVVASTTYSNLSKNTSTFTNQTPSTSTWSNLSKN